jgi:dihydroorotate dehydrogenase electron transfer subunit
MKQVAARVVSNCEVMPGVYLIWLEADQIASESKPGQFVMVTCGQDTVLPRPLSIHQSYGNKIALLSRVVGKGTQWLSQRQAGNTLNIFGPLGNGYSISLGSKNLLLVAGGIGVASLSFLAFEAKKLGKAVTLAMGANSQVHLIPTLPSEKGLITDGLLPFGITVYKSTDDGSGGYKGLVTYHIVEEKLIDKTDQIFACGPVPMYRTMAQMPELRDKRVQVSLEVVMGCGRGVCYGCTIKTKSGLKKVCEDGPVFDLDDILWDELDF